MLIFSSSALESLTQSLEMSISVPSPHSLLHSQKSTQFSSSKLTRIYNIIDNTNFPHSVFWNSLACLLTSVSTGFNIKWSQSLLLFMFGLWLPECTHTHTFPSCPVNFHSSHSNIVCWQNLQPVTFLGRATFCHCLVFVCIPPHIHIPAGGELNSKQGKERESPQQEGAMFAATCNILPYNISQRKRGTSTVQIPRSTAQAVQC